ncbi:hypothetical protein [Alkalicoccus saliphilus]|uniref:Transcriptional regulator n=1 Tax=Alkalicoccus saliphilus TaxID=200989 RepID=A0A2T4U498_9BACI|nr:hypothetical protein [Alkalicoccus saliphilus]PTL38230.1 hypothetical protein C6Y45_12570 [Alkalicoccus saliphilus]
MKTRVGVIGPEDSARIIEEMAGDFPDFVIESFYYKKTEETEQIIPANRHRVDVWLFSGQAPHAYALYHGLISEEEAFFPPLHGSSLLGTLLEVLRNNDRPSSFTIDTIDEKELKEIKKTHYLSDFVFTTYPYTGYKSSEEIIRFHLEQHKKHPETIALTCVRHVFTELRKQGVPVYRITASRSAIRETLKYLREKTSAVWYRSHQLAIIGIETLEQDSPREEYYSYRRRHKELDLKRMLLRYAEDIKGSFVQTGDGLFLIFTTRGEVESHPVPFFLIEEAVLQAGLPVRLALGYGKSVLEAEEHVHQALREARRREGQVIISVNENNEMTEYFAGEGSLSYASQLGPDWSDKLKGKVAPGIVSKIFSYARYHQQQEVTARDIARWLTSSERNARRILHELEEAGLAKVSGEEQEVRRGRPRKVFALQF